MIFKTQFTIGTPSVMLAIAFTMDHSRNISILRLVWQTHIRMTIARTGTSDSHVIDGIEIFFLKINAF